ncbi:MAG: hypothetical protein U0V74_04145 [Chitinophagales bacterium]
MKNFILTLAAIAIASLLLQFFLPWWVIAPIAFIAGYIFKQGGFSAFAAGFLAIFILWIAYAYKLSCANEHILATRITEVLKQLTGGKMIMLFVLTGLVGGLVSGFAALSGNMAQKLKSS